MSPAEARSLEEERRQRAARAVERLQRVEERVVTDAYATLALDLNRTNESFEVEVMSDLGPIKVAWLTVNEVQAAGGSLTLYVRGAFVEVLAETVIEVLDSSGLNRDDALLLSVAVMNQQNTSSLETDAIVGEASVLSSLALSINFWSTDGSRIEVKDLTHPLHFTIEVSEADAKCAFWDEDIDKWSDDGIRTLSSNHTLECSTSHLSIFAGVKDVFLRNIVLALSCSTISTLLSARAFEKLGKNSSWLKSTPSILNIVFHVLGAACIVVAWLYDRKQEKLIPWAEREVVLMRVRDELEDEQEDEDAPEPSLWTRCLGCCNHSLEYVSHASGGDATIDALKEVLENADTAVVNRAISSIQSHKSGIAGAQISILNQQTNAVVDLQRTQSSVSKVGQGSPTRFVSEQTKSCLIFKDHAAVLFGALRFLLVSKLAISWFPSFLCKSLTSPVFPSLFEQIKRCIRFAFGLFRAAEWLCLQVRFLRPVQIMVKRQLKHFLREAGCVG